MRYRNNWSDAIVEAVDRVAGDVVQIHLRPTAGMDPYTPGAHIDVQVWLGDATEVRSYSLVGTCAPGAPYCIAVRQVADSRGGSAYMATLEPGNRIRISRPVNHFELVPRPGTYLLLAGGIGITPLLAMAEQLVRGDGTQVRVVYTGKHREQMPYRDRLKILLGDRLHLHYSGSEGRLVMDALFRNITADTRVFMCGPLSLMDAVHREWELRRLPVANLRYETFGASGHFAPQDFKVRIPGYDRELEVGKNESLLQVLEAAGIDVLSDCRKGECGLCMVDILEFTGDIDHRDCFLSTEQKGENRKLCACVSRVANGHVTIDTGYRGNGS